MFILKKIFSISLVMMMVSIFTNAGADEESVKVIDATKNIEFLSQKIAKDYLYLEYDPKKKAIESDLFSSIEILEENFRFVAKNTNNSDAKDILDFLSYGKDQIKEIVDKNITHENSILMLDATEALYEGAKSILKTYKYNSLNDKDIKVGLMRVLKLYMAIHLDINPKANKLLLQDEINILEKNNIIFNSSWQSLRNLLDTDKKYFIPNVVFILMKHLETNKS